MIVLVYVDDLLFVSNTADDGNRAAKDLLKVFEGTNDGIIQWYLGIKVNTKHLKRSLSQPSYALSMLEEYSLTDIRQYDTPISKCFCTDLAAHKSAGVLDCPRRYQAMIGSLNHIAIKTRPDISTAVGILVQYVSAPTSFLMKSVHRVFGYLKSTASSGLVQEKSKSLAIDFFCDSDYAGDMSDRKSRTG